MNKEVIATGTSKGKKLIVRVIEKQDKEIEVRLYGTVSDFLCFWVV